MQLLVRAYQVRGHHVADLDPLGILDPDVSFASAKLSSFRAVDVAAIIAGDSFSIAAASTPLALADVEFTYPLAGASISPGEITVKWEESGKAPAISQLESYVLTLVVGGNEESNAVRITCPVCLS